MEEKQLPVSKEQCLVQGESLPSSVVLTNRVIDENQLYILPGVQKISALTYFNHFKMHSKHILNSSALFAINYFVFYTFGGFWVFSQVNINTKLKDQILHIKFLLKK